MKLLISALDHSANIHLKALKKKLSDDIEFIGIFDKTLGNPHIDIGALAIMGFVDALRKLPFFLKLSRKMVELAADADKVLLIDSSGFNLPLAKKIRKRYPEKEIIYYILPQAWAWKKKRIPVLERTIDTLASILPFEPGYYSENAPIEYVGHPLLDEITHYKQVLTNTGKIAFMPGSRASEIKGLMPVYKKLRARLNTEAYVIIPRHLNAEKINELYGNLSGFKKAYHVYETLNKCDFAFICSGTATLEASLIGIPFVLSYIAKPIDFLIAKNIVKVKYIGLSNIMYKKFKGEQLHPEFIQKDVTVENLLAAYTDMDRTVFLEKAIQLRNYLQHGSASRVAQIIENGN